MTAKSRVPGLIIATGLAVASLALASLAVAGCADVPSGPAAGSAAATSQPRPGDELVVLAGTPGSMHVFIAEPGGIQPVAAAGLPPTAAWLSGAYRTLLVTTLAGGILTSAIGPDAAPGSSPPAWTTGSGDLGGGRPSRAFGTLDPASLTAALVEGAPGSGEPGRLVIETLAGRSIRTLGLAQAAESAPAWLPDGRVVVVVRDRNDQPRPMIADPVIGSLASMAGGPIRAVAVGGVTFALIGVDGRASVNTVDGWLAGDAARPIPAGSDGPDPEVLQAQPSLAGTEVALVVANDDGDATGIRIVLAGDGREIARYALPPGANRAVVGWLTAP